MPEKFNIIIEINKKNLYWIKFNFEAIAAIIRDEIKRIKISKKEYCEGLKAIMHIPIKSNT